MAEDLKAPFRSRSRDMVSATENAFFGIDFYK